jgi:hypothetical protein
MDSSRVQLPEQSRIFSLKHPHFNAIREIGAFGGHACTHLVQRHHVLDDAIDFRMIFRKVPASLKVSDIKGL